MVCEKTDSPTQVDKNEVKQDSVRKKKSKQKIVLNK